MTSWEFPCDGPIELAVNIAAGTVTVSAEPVSAATVHISRSGWGAGADPESEISVDYDDGQLRVAQHLTGLRLRGHSFDVHVVVPPGSDCRVATAAADVTGRGEIGGLSVKTASGTVTSDLVRGTADVATMSGPVRLGEVTGRASAKTASGRIAIASATGDVDVTSVSGDISVGTAHAGVAASTASGRIRIDSVSHGDVAVNTVSGDVSIGVAPGVGVYLDISSLSGRVSSELAPDEGAAADAGLRLHGRSVSGALRVSRAQSATVAG